MSSVPPIVPTSAPRGHSNKHGKRAGAGGGKGRGTSLFLSPGAHDGRSSFARSSNMSPFCPSRENGSSAAGALASPSGMDGNLDPNGNDANGPCPLPFPCPSASCNRTFATYSSMSVQFPPLFPVPFSPFCASSVNAHSIIKTSCRVTPLVVHPSLPLPLVVIP